MVRFLGFSIVYALVAIAVSWIGRGNADHLLSVVDHIRQLVHSAPIASAAMTLLAGAALFIPGKREALIPVYAATLGTLLFMNAFSMLKSSMPNFGPFWADPMLARIDAALHGGVAPWEFAHRIAPHINPEIASVLYIEVWCVAVSAFLPLIAALDGDRERRDSYARIFVLLWVICGNILAFGFLSAGPIYFEDFHVAGAFDGLEQALASSGVLQTQTGALQQVLLEKLQTRDATLGSGISAFPSLHVAMATLFALYLHDRFRHLAATTIGLAYLATILFLSVYLGWHYAIDGYVSIAAVLLIRAQVRRRNGRIELRRREWAAARIDTSLN